MLVSDDLGQVLGTDCYRSGYGTEACTCFDLVVRQSAGAFVRITLADVETSAIRALRRSSTVRTDEVIAAVVTLFLFRLGECAVDVLNTR